MLDNYINKVLWGCGRNFDKEAYKLIDDVQYIIDSQKFGEIKCGRKVDAPDILETLEPKDTLIIVMVSEYEPVYEQIEKYGDFSAVFYTDYLFIRDISSFKNIDFDNGKIVISVATAGALCSITGLANFIIKQDDIIRKYGYQMVHVMPTIILLNGEIASNMIIVSVNGKTAIFCDIDELIMVIPKVEGIVVHDILPKFTVLGELLDKIKNNGKILFYLHCYLCVSKNEKLYNTPIPCSGFQNVYCKKCNEYEGCYGVYKYYKALFENFNVELVAPSEVVKNIVGRIYPNVNILMIEHLQYKVRTREACTNDNKIRIAFLGRAIETKGWKEYMQLIPLLSLEYEAYLLGSNPENEINERISEVDVGLLNDNNVIGMVDALKRYKIDIAFIGSVWKETYSYTYFEAYEAGVYVVTNGNSGNICECVKKNKNGIVYNTIDELAEYLNMHTDYFKNKHSVTHIYDVKPDESFMNDLLRKK